MRMNLATKPREHCEFLAFVKRGHAEIGDAIRSSADLSDDTVSALESAVAEFKRQFTTSEGHPLVKDVPVEPVTEEEVIPTQITKVVRK